jgi:hypothetical protein
VAGKGLVAGALRALQVWAARHGALEGAAVAELLLLDTHFHRLFERTLEQVRNMQVGPEFGPTSAFYSCILTIMCGPTCIFWANLTPFSLYCQYYRQPVAALAAITAERSRERANAEAWYGNALTDALTVTEAGARAKLKRGRTLEWRASGTLSRGRVCH